MKFMSSAQLKSQFREFHKLFKKKNSVTVRKKRSLYPKIYSTSKLIKRLSKVNSNSSSLSSRFQQTSSNKSFVQLPKTTNNKKKQIFNSNTSKLAFIKTNQSNFEFQSFTYKTMASSTPLHENRLAKEKSPYLLQHKNNPVDCMFSKIPRIFFFFFALFCEKIISHSCLFCSFIHVLKKTKIGYPWGNEAFEKAKSEDKLIFLSVGCK